MVITKIGDGLIGPRVARPPGRARRQKRKLVLCCLRVSVDARPVLAEHLHWRRGGVAEEIICTSEIHVKFGLVAARPKIGVHPTQRRRRVIAPTGVINGVGRYIAGQVSDLAAGLYGRHSAAI